MSDDSGHASRIAGQLAMYDDGENEEAIRRCNSESFSGHDFEVFGYTVDDNVTVEFFGDFEEDVPPRELAKHCEENGITCYRYGYSELDFATQN
ncbi:MULTISPECIES: hypothetical protein [Halorubrum]|uniref:DUF7961 domain-containing protein n=2 Tax=Halorubrum ezzemoulense TaxID=337243 RepID=A0A256JBB2_HALEZ|nr:MULTISPECIES: hypothetical protein [Halorubrum]MDB2238441.1 hypothetical protein [Halorubrum ezzemoulense]MDB2247911.1 hypothetical protein [Halorubrum ezzemoulense]MDB2281255.1 hypothetical protein [Halorubrum ezzemoulense]OTF01584.1 hypothetical protein B9G49_01760 [Halorubrum sp. SD683]OYR66145.1 hypothetical protein DJ80_00655 [Halorubrum ezzemoulense]